jgi:voltage-gated potassium channel
VQDLVFSLSQRLRSITRQDYGAPAKGPVDWEFSYNIGKRIAYTVFYFICIFTLHVAAMMFFEKMSFGDSLWLTFSTVTTVGYGDYYASTFWGRTATVILIYIGSIFILAHSLGIYFESRADKRRRILLGQWRWNMKNHILLLNVPEFGAEQYVKRLVSELRQGNEYKDTHILIVTQQFKMGFPHELQRLQNIVHYDGKPNDPTALLEAHPENAKAVIILAEREGDSTSDGETFDILHRLKELGTEGVILAECVEDYNRPRLKASGAQIVVRPMRGYPEMVAGALEAPGTEQIMEDMFESQGQNDCLKFKIHLENITWRHIVKTLMDASIGTALGYMDMQGKIICNPPSQSTIIAQALFVLTHHPLKIQEDDVKKALGL